MEDILLSQLIKDHFILQGKSNKLDYDLIKVKELCFWI